MNGRDLVRAVRAVGLVGAVQGLRTVRSSWRRRRTDAVGLRRRGPERARVPGPVTGASSARWWRRPVHAVRSADHGDGDGCGLLGLGRGGPGAVVRAGGFVSAAGSAGCPGAGQGRRLAGGGGAGDRRRVAARRCLRVHSGRCGAAAGSAAALVGAHGRGRGAVGAAVRGRGRRAVLRVGRPGLGASAAGRRVPAVEHGSGRFVRVRRTIRCI